MGSVCVGNDRGNRGYYCREGYLSRAEDLVCICRISTGIWCVATDDDRDRGCPVDYTGDRDEASARLLCCTAVVLAMARSTMLLSRHNDWQATV